MPTLFMSLIASKKRDQPTASDYVEASLAVVLFTRILEEGEGDSTAQ